LKYIDQFFCCPGAFWRSRDFYRATRISAFGKIDVTDLVWNAQRCLAPLGVPGTFGRVWQRWGACLAPLGVSGAFRRVWHPLGVPPPLGVSDTVGWGCLAPLGVPPPLGVSDTVACLTLLGVPGTGHLWACLIPLGVSGAFRRIRHIVGRVWHLVKDREIWRDTVALDD
jgi:hypothetical protein